ncbi:hypothetical protein GF406_09410 [candidate division KSB1 bacterium]|jgi:hypothetical protein|nr:hypothetical protein [candidate division KSB1 bacterium]
MMEKRNRYPACLHDVEFLDQISAAALANILLNKGVVTAEELLHAEREIRQSIKSPHAKETGLRKVVSRHRMLRRITHLLFGWQWKKSKIHTRRSDIH